MSQNAEDLEIQRIMSTEGGRSFMWSLIEASNVFGSTYDGDATKHAYNSGIRDFGVIVMHKLIHSAPDNYLRMLKENMTDG